MRYRNLIVNDRPTKSTRTSFNPIHTLAIFMYVINEWWQMEQKRKKIKIKTIHHSELSFRVFYVWLLYALSPVKVRNAIVNVFYRTDCNQGNFFYCHIWLSSFMPSVYINNKSNQCKNNSIKIKFNTFFVGPLLSTTQ